MQRRTISGSECTKIGTQSLLASTAAPDLQNSLEYEPRCTTGHKDHRTTAITPVGGEGGDPAVAGEPGEGITGSFPKLQSLLILCTFFDLHLPHAIIRSPFSDRTVLGPLTMMPARINSPFLLNDNSFICRAWVNEAPLSCCKTALAGQTVKPPVQIDSFSSALRSRCRAPLTTRECNAPPAGVAICEALEGWMPQTGRIRDQ